ncbi:MAG: hypothetical protein DRO52_02420 [Candidatus Hecatellales archaeon]|nr:MAG: hypothetical protein DRO52_02420 [Candidatus Hecatellales archaeon]
MYAWFWGEKGVMVRVGRGKRRYLLFHLTTEGGRPEAWRVEKAVYEAYKKLFGVKGLSEAELAWISYEENSGFGILRCSHRAVARVRTALTLIDELDGRKARICTVRVSGTGKTLKKTLSQMKSS